MNDNSRSLTLTIKASNPDDFNALLRQARYEIEKLLPLPEDSSEDARRKRTSEALMSGMFTEQSQITKGHSQGTLGSYEFEMVKGSQAYADLERELLNRGFERKRLTGLFRTDGLEFYYSHDEHGIKIIDGNPLALRDYAPGEDF
jgi:hypothetical protein